MTAASAGAAPDNLGWACCGRWAADRARFALYCRDAAGNASAWTFWDIQREANRFSNVLAALGVMRGERVAVLLPQCAAAAALYIGCWQMGAVAMPLPAQLDANALARALAAAAANVAVVSAARQETLATARAAAGQPRHVIGIGGARAGWLREWAALRPLASARYTPLDGVADAPALRFDAGEFTHAALAQDAERFFAAHPGYPQAGDLFWSPADWATPAGLLEGLLPAWRCGQPVVAYDGDFSGEAAVALIAKYDVRNARLAPHELEAMMAAVPKPNDSYDCRLRTLATGGAAPAAPLAAWLQAELGVAGAATTV